MPIGGRFWGRQKYICYLVLSTIIDVAAAAFHMLTISNASYHNSRWCSILCFNIYTGSSIAEHLPTMVHAIPDEFNTSFHIPTQG